MKIKFLGAAGTVTGSGYLLTANSGDQLLIDLGLFQGPPEIDSLSYQPLEMDCSSLDGVILTHAHLDHCGRLPLLEKLGFKGSIYMTAPTSELTELSLLDSAKIAQEDRPDTALYDQNHVQDVVRRFKIVNYDQSFTIQSFQVTLRDAGHIIGSASVEVEVDSQKIVFSGDLGNTPEDLTQPTSPITSADFVVMESTYGDKIHDSGVAKDILRAEINTIEQSRGTLLIPAFSLERTQVVLHLISHLKSANLILPETPVYLDSPMAQKATTVYKKYSSFLNSEIKNDFLTSDPFSFPGLHLVHDRQESSRLNTQGGPQVIIAGSGMMMGGRIVDHAKHFLLQGTTRLLIIGYQGEGTLGRQLQDGDRVVQVGDQKIHVNAQVINVQVMSSHADQPRLLSWIRPIQGVRQVFLTHGEDGPRQVLSDKIKAELRLPAIILPTLNQELTVG